MSAATFTPSGNPPGNSVGYGTANPNADFGQSGWGFELAVSTHWYDKTFEGFGSVFLGELVHSVGTRGGKTYFNDEAGAAALAHLGVALSLEEYTNLVASQSQLPLNGNGKPYLPYGGSKLFHGVLDDICARPRGANRFSGVRR